MYNERLEQLIDAALADGELTEKEKQILFKKAQEMGVDLDEFEMVLDGRLVKLKKAEEEKAKSSAPKSNKLGDVKKCPSCGAIVQSYQGVCSECGFAFEGLDANSAVKELSNLLQKTSNQNQMEKVIDTYPVPMEKASLLAFVTWLRPQSTDGKNPLANSYFKKYSECVNKIRVSFANDKDLLPFLSYYESDVKKIRNHKIVKFTLKNKWFWIGVAVFLILILILKPKPFNKNPKKTNAAIITAVDNGDYKKAQEYVINFEGNMSDIRQGIRALTTVYVKEGKMEQARIVAGGQANDILAKGYLEGGLYDEYMNCAGMETTGEFIRDVIVDLCKKGKKKEAIRFLNSYSDRIHDEYDNLGLGSYPTRDGGTSMLGDRKYVTGKLREIIDNY